MPEFVLPRKLQGNGFGLGLNGILKGEPHLILVNSSQDYLQLIDYLGINLPVCEQSAILNSLRKAVNLLGNKVTFEKSLFPKGMNLSIAVVLNQRIYISTHERNLASSRKDCRNQQSRYKRCRCNTASCGTAGAVAANLAYIRGLLRSKDIVTVHPGGDIIYLLDNQGTIMTGEVKLTVANGNI